MVNTKIVYPYCRHCNKTRDDPNKWAKLTTNGKPRKSASCGQCGQMLAWGPASRASYRNLKTLQNIDKNKDTKTDIKENMELWKDKLNE